ncbi:MAG: hypothetical protein NTX33_16035 [Propionibacteriales bacterium]|nr:hypothetical protein [Propionibacteriales bacterium]
MSKMDGLRAMREAKYAAAAARSGTPAKAAPKKPVAKAAPTTAAAEPASDAETDEALCGHRNISGRTCTRERGHSAKSHRYS